MSAHVLVVDDDPEMRAMLEEWLLARGHAVSAAGSASEALVRVEAGDVDVVLTDLRMPGGSGVDLCQQIVAARPEVPVIVMTAFGSLETAVATIRAGAADFLTKPLDGDAVALAVERAVAQRRLRVEVKRLRRAVEQTVRFDELVGGCTAMREVYAQVEKVADSEATVLITGESGTGKELVAHSLHARSRRRDGPFVAVSCGAIPGPLLESQLFGHAKGAFTDARDKHVGLFVEANGGTLFLDEVVELPLELQVKLLRALETRLVRPLGATQEVAFDGRIVAATNRDLEVAVDERRFREDLLYRLNVIQLELPPLRARGTDVLRIAEHFLALFAERSGKPPVSLSQRAAASLVAYPWPGNVRELKNAIERGVALASSEEIAVEDLPRKIQEYRGTEVLVASDDPTELVTMEEVERRYALKVLEVCGGNRNMSARILGWDRKTLYRRLSHWSRPK